MNAIAVLHRVETNKFGGVYLNGKPYDYCKKVEIVMAYKHSQVANGGNRPSISALSKQCRVSRGFIKKIEKEMEKYGRVLRIEEKYQVREGPVGPGSASINELDSFILLMLYFDEPSRILPSYVEWLQILSGTVLSECTVSRFFKGAFPYRASLYRPNLVPFDKFRRVNLEKATEYLNFVSLIEPTRIKFGDEKLLKGEELFSRNVRRNPLTGEIPALLTTPDFRNTYSLTGFCGIDVRVSPVFFSIHESNNDAIQFALDLEDAISHGFLCPGDILVLDNAAYHCGGENSKLDDWLWSRHHIFLLFLPPRSPELNPIELVWNILVRRLKKVSLNSARNMGCDAVAYAAHCILEQITHDEVRRLYKHCGLMID